MEIIFAFNSLKSGTKYSYTLQQNLSLSENCSGLKNICMEYAKSFLLN
jgi:hypothetical protein